MYRCFVKDMATDMPPCKRCICMLSIKCFSKSECFFRSSYSNKYLQDQQCLLWCHGLFPHVQQGFSSGSLLLSIRFRGLQQRPPRPRRWPRLPLALRRRPRREPRPGGAVAALGSGVVHLESQEWGFTGLTVISWFSTEVIYELWNSFIYLYRLSGSFSQLPASSFTDSRISTNLIVGRWEECDSFIKTPNQKMGWQGQTWLAMAERWDKPSGSFRLVH